MCRSWSLVVVVALTTPVSGAAAQATPLDTAAVLDGVMDTLSQGDLVTYGDTAVLRAAILEHASLERPLTVPQHLVGERVHNMDWLTSRARTPGLLGICLDVGVNGCRLGPTTAVLTLSLPRFEGPSRAAVQVAIRRPTGGPPQRRGGFSGQWLLILERGETGWRVVGGRIMGIT